MERSRSALKEAVESVESELEAALAEAAAAPSREADAAALEELSEQAAVGAKYRTELERLQVEHAKLNEEYKKLQSEYNEWIDMLEQE